MAQTLNGDDGKESKAKVYFSFTRYYYAYFDFTITTPCG